MPAPPLIAQAITLQSGQSTGYKTLTRPDTGGEPAAVYSPGSGLINLTALLKSADLGKSRRDAVLRALPPGTQKTVLKGGAALLRGTWTSFACALEVVEMWGLPGGVRDVVLAADEDHEES
jgi:hypothetical protein